MTWNWQQPDWPTFQWDEARLETAEKQFLVGGGMLLGTVRHLGNEERDQLTIEAMSTEAVTTSEIEGEILDRVSVQSSLRKQLGPAPQMNGASCLRPRRRSVRRLNLRLPKILRNL